MKQGIHPEYPEVVFMDMENGLKYVTRSTVSQRGKSTMDDS